MGVCLFVDRYWIGTRTSRGLVLVVVTFAITFALVVVVKPLSVSSPQLRHICEEQFLK